VTLSLVALELAKFRFRLDFMFAETVPCVFQNFSKRSLITLRGVRSST